LKNSENKTPKVSIITCFLNTEKYLDEAIKSVLEQDYPYWELILVDDGSTDLSTQIAKQYRDAYPNKIFYFDHANHANLGASKSRNIGIENGSGDLVTFLDGDDILMPAMLSSLVKVWNENDAALVMEASEYWYSWNDVAKNNEIVQVGASQNKLYDPPELMTLLYPIGDGAAPCICGLLADKKILQKHGSFDESFKGMYDDQSLLIKFYLHEKVFVSGECHNRYRQRPGSLVSLSKYKMSLLYFSKQSFRMQIFTRCTNPISPLKFRRISWVSSSVSKGNCVLYLSKISG
jgi:glycosyltransferase involved in cell wall biosynthesis